MNVSGLEVDPAVIELDAAVLVSTFSQPLQAMAPSEALARWLTLQPDPPAPMTADDAVRAAVRDLLRQGGYKPTGRGKPASEYLLRAAGEGKLQPINPAVDVCNVVSLHSGLPISVVDLDRAAPPFRIALAPAGARYVFNASGQEIDLAGLPCLFDAQGPCANAVKDSQRTKTSGATRRTLTVIWGSTRLGGRSAEARKWYAELVSELGAAVTGFSSG